MSTKDELQKKGKEQSWPTLKYHPTICLVGLKKTVVNLGQPTNQDPNPGPHKHGVGF
jgi:hypothetical protein